MRISEAGEFNLIDKIAALIGKKSIRKSGPLHDLLIGIGDDSAAWRTRAGTALITTDTLVEGTHFHLSYTGWNDLGWKSIVINISDIYAMGGRPQYAIVSLAIPCKYFVSNILELYEGMIHACNRYNAAIVGGNLSSSKNLVINVTLSGIAGKSMMSRSSAKKGDLIAVMGYTGLSAAWLKALNEKREDIAPSAFKLFKAAHLHPEPPFDSGPILVACGVKSGIDISDGLLADLGHICKASKVSAVVYSHSLPVHPALVKYYKEDYIDLVLNGGEDYTLLFTAPRNVMDSVMESLHPSPVIIGEITAGKGGEITVLDSSGNPIETRKSGWDHFIKA